MEITIDNTLEKYMLDGVLPGEEGISDAARRVINGIRSWWNKLDQSYDTINEIYTESILKSEKSYGRPVEHVLKTVKANICPRNILLNVIVTNAKVTRYILDEAMKEAKKLHTSGNLQVGENDFDYTKLSKEVAERIAHDVEKMYKQAKVEPGTIQKNKRMCTFAEAGYKNLSDISSLIKTARHEWEEMRWAFDRMVKQEHLLLTIIGGALLISFLGNIVGGFLFGMLAAYNLKVSSLYNILAVSTNNLIYAYNEVDDLLTRIDKGFAMESFIDTGIESYFFNQYKNGDIEFNDTFGKITYNEQHKFWSSKDFFTPNKDYTQYSGKNTWTGTRIPEPIKETYQRLGKLFTQCFNKRHVFEGFLSTIAESINAAQEKNNSFGVSCNPEFIVTGKDRRFFIQSIDFCHPKSTNTDSILVTMCFNNREFYAIFNDKLQMYSYIPKEPKIISSYPSNNMLTDVNHPQEYKQLDFALGMEGFKSSNSDMYQKFNEELTSIVEGEYDQEDTEVVVNPVDDQAADVDIRIDLTPNREQQLLRALNYECKFELDCYGIEGLTNKVAHNTHNFETMFTELYKNLDKSIKYLNNTKSNLFDNLVLQFNVDIENKEKFLDIIKTSSTSVFNAFSNLKTLAESSDITIKNTNKTDLVLYSNDTTVYDANFTSKEDIQFVANELQKTRLNVNIPQIKFYTNKIMNKLSSKKYTSDKYRYVSEILNEMNNTLVNLANVLSQGERFISSIAIHANS